MVVYAKVGEKMKKETKMSSRNTRVKMKCAELSARLLKSLVRARLMAAACDAVEYSAGPKERGRTLQLGQPNDS